MTFWGSLHRLLTGTMGQVRRTLGTFASVVSQPRSNQFRITGLNKETIKLKGYPPVTSMVHQHRPILFDIRPLQFGRLVWAI